MTTEEKIELAERMKHLESNLLCHHQDITQSRFAVDAPDGCGLKWADTPLEALRAAHIGDPEPEPSDTELIAHVEAVNQWPVPWDDFGERKWRMYCHKAKQYAYGDTWRSCVIAAIRAEREAGK